MSIWYLVPVVQILQKEYFAQLCLATTLVGWIEEVVNGHLRHVLLFFFYEILVAASVEIHLATYNSRVATRFHEQEIPLLRFASFC